LHVDVYNQRIISGVSGEILNGTKTSLANGVKPGMVNHWIIRSTKSKDLRKSKRQTTMIHGRFKLSGPTRNQKGADTEGEKKKNKPGNCLSKLYFLLNASLNLSQRSFLHLMYICNV
jgi:hypothetical protein